MTNQKWPYTNKMTLWIEVFQIKILMTELSWGSQMAFSLFFYKIINTEKNSNNELQLITYLTIYITEDY